MEPQPSTHWDSEKFDEFMEHANKNATTLPELARMYKPAYLLAKCKAPWAKTAGKEKPYAEYRPRVTGVPSVLVCYPINLGALHRFLLEEGALDDEDSPK